MRYPAKLIPVLMEALIIFGAKYLFAIVLLGSISGLLLLPKRERTTYILTAALVGVLAFALTKLAGSLYDDPRPFTHGVRSLFPHDADNGFPSDHTVLSVAAALVSLRASRRLGISLLALAVLVGLCRVLSGVHAPIDVIAGAVIAAVAAGLGGWIIERINGGRAQKPA